MMQVLKWVYVLILFAEATPKSVLPEKISIGEEPTTTKKPSNISKKDLEKFTAIENVESKTKKRGNVSASEDESISPSFEMTDAKSEPLKINLSLNELLKSSIEVNRVAKPKKSKKRFIKNKALPPKKELPITWPNLDEAKDTKAQATNQHDNSKEIIEPTQMQTQIAEHLFIPDVFYGAGHNPNILAGSAIHHGNDLTFLLDDKLKLGYAPHQPAISNSPPIHHYTPIMHHHAPAAPPLSHHPTIYKHSPPSITIPAHGSLFNHWPYLRPYGLKFHYYPPHPYHHRRPKYPLFPVGVGGKFPLPPGHGYGFTPHGPTRRPATVVYMYPYYPPAKDKPPIVGFSDWKEKPIKEHIEDDIMYDFRTKTHSINR